MMMDLFIKPAYAAKQSIDGQFDLAYPDLASFIDLVKPLAFSIAAIMVSFYFIIGALELITSQGDKAHIVSARAKIYHSIIGFVLLILIFLVMQYLPELLLGPKSGQSDFRLF